jgi:hypothetical protein
MGKTIVIGDVHGCLVELKELLAACEYQPGDDVVFVGDLVARGPDSLGVLELIRNIGARSVLGNHDHALLLLRKALHADVKPPVIISRSRLAVSLELRSDDWKFLETLPLFIRLPDYQAVVVHAGLVPGIPIENQDPYLLMNIRTVTPDGKGSEEKTDGVLWGTLWKGPETVIFGHHASRGLQKHPYAIGIDTGCVYGGRLTAYLLADRRFVSVEAKQIYSPK